MPKASSYGRASASAVLRSRQRNSRIHWTSLLPGVRPGRMHRRDGTQQCPVSESKRSGSRAQQRLTQATELDLAQSDTTHSRAISCNRIRSMNKKETLHPLEVVVMLESPITWPAALAGFFVIRPQRKA